MLDVDCQSGLAMTSYPGPYGQVLTNLVLNAIAHAFPIAREVASISRYDSPARTMSRPSSLTMVAA